MLQKYLCFVFNSQKSPSFVRNCGKFVHPTHATHRTRGPSAHWFSNPPKLLRGLIFPPQPCRGSLLHCSGKEERQGREPHWWYLCGWVCAQFVLVRGVRVLTSMLSPVSLLVESRGVSEVPELSDTIMKAPAAVCNIFWTLCLMAFLNSTIW